MELTVQNVYGLLIRSQLLSVDEARSMFARWQEEAKDNATNLIRFAAWMVANRFVTEYQATLLVQGHAEGFFLNEYKILERLGKGRMAGVYKAQHKLGPPVALKVLPPSKARDPIMLARFQREAKLALRMKHPNIVRSFQMGQAGDLRFLVMEHLEGETLEDYLLRRKQLPPPEAVRLIYQAVQGLQHIHELGVVHRDLKPSNLMLVPPPTDNTLRCTLKILDIGLGRALFTEGPSDQDPGLTGEGVLLGTPDYMAPEQARDPRSTDIRADIYSLGCVLYHLLAGQPPFPDTNLITQMIRHATEAARPLKEFNKDIPDGLQQIVSWMMAKDPAGRYPTPERAAQALEVFLAAGNVTALSTPDLDPSMTPYLNWVESENRKAPASGAAMPVATAVAPAGKPTSATVPAVPSAAKEDVDARTGRAERASRKDESVPSSSERKRKKKHAPPPVPGDGAATSVNVELIAPAADSGILRFPPRLTRRDLMMFGAGVGCVLVAYAVGWGLSALFGGSREPKD